MEQQVRCSGGENKCDEEDECCFSEYDKTAFVW